MSPPHATHVVWEAVWHSGYHRQLSSHRSPVRTRPVAVLPPTGLAPVDWGPSRFCSHFTTLPSSISCVLQWKHPGLQRRWSQVRTPLPEPPIKRSGGSGKGAGGVAASHRAWAVVGRTAAGGWAHFSYIGCVYMISDAAPLL